MSLRWIDNHCHLGDEAETWLASAREVGVERFIDVGCDLATSIASADRAAEHDGVYATAGVHPHEARYGLDGIEDLLARPEVIAVGECGLDYFYDHSPRREQKDVFAAQIQLAHRHELPLVIHTRDAWEDTFGILDTEGVPERTIFHCFTGGPDEATESLNRGAFLSYSGIVTFKSASDLRAAAKITPLDRILVETDSPYLAPVPHRGRQNQPAHVTLVGAAVADVHGVDVATVAEATWQNTHRAYPGLTST